MRCQEALNNLMADSVNKEATSACAVVERQRKSSASTKRPAMMKAELLGRHTHFSGNGTKVNIWQRGTAYLARGYCDGARFGETLGHDEASAALRLHEI